MTRGSRIEEESFRIIEEEIGEHPFRSLEFPLVQRVIHAAADFEMGRSLVFSEGAVERGIQAVRAGASVITDTSMAAAGISRPMLERAGAAAILCRIADPGIREMAGAKGLTRAAAAVRSLGDRIPEAIVVIGNAPTALREVLRLHHEEGIRPLLLIAVPVGFVDAAESKDALRETDLTYITNRGRKGGTPAAVALVNALCRLAVADQRA